MHVANKRWFRGLLLAGIYSLGVLGIVACSGNGGDGGDITQVIVPPVVADLSIRFLSGSLDPPFSAD